MEARLSQNEATTRRYSSVARPSSGIAGWRGRWIARIGSEGTRPALLPAGPVLERWNVEAVFIETPHGPAINWTSWFAIFDAGRNLHAGAPQMKGLHPDPASESRKGKSQYCSVVQAFLVTDAGSSLRGNEPPHRSPSGSGYAGLNTEVDPKIRTSS